MQPAIPFREGPIDPPPAMRSSRAPWIALGTSAGALLFALAGAYTCFAKSLFDTPGFDAVVPTLAAIVFALVPVTAIRRAREVTPHRARTRIAIGIVVLALLFDALGLLFYVEALRRPPPPPPAPYNGPHINLCDRAVGSGSYRSCREDRSANVALRLSTPPRRGLAAACAG